MLKNNKIIAVIALFITVLCWLTVNANKKIDIDFNEISYLTSDNYQDFYLKNGTKTYKLPGDGYHAIYADEKKKEIYLLNNMGFVKIDNHGSLEKYNGNIKNYPIVENKNNILSTPRSMSEGSFVEDGITYLYSFYDNGSDSDSQVSSSLFRIYNTETNKIVEKEIQGYVLNSYYDNVNKEILYTGEIRKIVDEEPEYFAGSIDESLKNKKLYDINLYKGMKGKVHYGTLIPKEKNYLCLACDKDKNKLEKYENIDADEKLVDSKKVFAKEEYLDNSLTQNEENLIIDQIENMYVYNKKTEAITKYRTPGRNDYDQVVEKNNKIYYIKGNSLCESNKDGNVQDVEKLQLEKEDKVYGIYMK